MYFTLFLDKLGKNSQFYRIRRNNHYITWVLRYPFFKEINERPVILARACILSTWKAEQGDSHELSQSELHSRRPSQKKIIKIRYGELRDSERRWTSHSRSQALNFPGNRGSVGEGHVLKRSLSPVTPRLPGKNKSEPTLRSSPIPHLQSQQKPYGAKVTKFCLNKKVFSYKALRMQGCNIHWTGSKHLLNCQKGWLSRKLDYWEEEGGTSLPTLRLGFP